MFVIAMVFLRWFCLRAEEDIVAVLVMLSTAPYFLFFCRYVKHIIKEWVTEKQVRDIA
jgi:hypothetical protein